MIRGSIVALVTPFNASGAVDYEALRRLVEFHVTTRAPHGIVAVGTTGESATRCLIPKTGTSIRATVDFVAGRIPVIAGADQTLLQRPAN